MLSKCSFFASKSSVHSGGCPQEHVLEVVCYARGILQVMLGPREQ